MEINEVNGMNAILQHLKSVYGHSEGVIIEGLQRERIDEDGVLENVLVYEVKNPVRHWHYISLGLSELYDKVSEYEDVSGFGIELTFRLLAKDGERTPPTWAKHLLQNLSAYVYADGVPLMVDDYMDTQGAICTDEQTALCGIVCVEDEILRTVQTPNGAVQFIQVVGLTKDELAEVAGVGYQSFLKRLKQSFPLCITNLYRKSLLSSN
jgi:hypothetical protein